MKKLSLDAFRGKKENIVSNNLLTMISGGDEDSETEDLFLNGHLRQRPRRQVFE